MKLFTKTLNTVNDFTIRNSNSLLLGGRFILIKNSFLRVLRNVRRSRQFHPEKYGEAGLLLLDKSLPAEDIA